MATSEEETLDSPCQNSVNPLPAEAVRWRCDPSTLPFGSTKEVEPMVGVVGQDDAMEALRFGLETNAPGQNVFVRGLTGTGRMTLLKRMMEDIQPTCPLALDRCYVHNFTQPDRPRLITLARGRGEEFRRRVDKVVEFIRDDLAAALVLHYISNDGYNFFSRIRASSVLNRQFTLAFAAFRSASQAAISRVNSSALSIRRSRHCRLRMPSSISAMSSQLPCLGV